MATYDEDDVRDFRGRGHGREGELEHGRRLRRCGACAQPIKDHTAPATKRCAAMSARRRGFKPWMLDVDAAVAGVAEDEGGPQ